MNVANYAKSWTKNAIIMHSVGQLVVKLSKSLYHSLALTMHRWLCTLQTDKLVNPSCYLLLPVATCHFLWKPVCQMVLGTLVCPNKSEKVEKEKVIRTQAQSSVAIIK